MENTWMIYIVFNWSIGLLIYVYRTSRVSNSFKKTIQEIKGAYNQVFATYGTTWDFVSLAPYLKKKYSVALEKFFYIYFYGNAQLSRSYGNFMIARFFINIILCIIFNLIYWPLLQAALLSLAQNNADFVHSLFINWDWYVFGFQIVCLMVPAVVLWRPYLMDYNEDTVSKNKYLKNLTNMGFRIDQALIEKSIDRNREANIKTYGLDVNHK